MKARKIHPDGADATRLKREMAQAINFLVDDVAEIYSFAKKFNARIPIIPHRNQLAGIFSNPANPTGTGSLVGVMMGLAIPFMPLSVGNLVFFVAGTLDNTIGSGGVSTRIRIGTGAPPANGAALTGTPLGVLKNDLAATAGDRAAFACIAPAAGLVVGTAYWLDMEVAATFAGVASLYDLDVSIQERPSTFVA